MDSGLLGALFLSAAMLFSNIIGSWAGDPSLPDPVLTPGVVNHAVTNPCDTLWGRDVRHVTLSMKKTVFAEYGISYTVHSRYEVDHLISRELGGADDVKNLWPQHWSHPFGAHEKDRYENLLHKLVCSGALTLSQAQQEIATDWIAGYKKRIPQ